MKWLHKMVAMLSRQQARLVDKISIEEYGIPGIVLMENAARGVVEVIDSLFAAAGKGRDATKISIVCGGGNNGGDGYAVARHLYNVGYDVNIFAVSDPTKLSGDAAINYNIIVKMGLNIESVLNTAEIKSAELRLQRSDLIVDAILGTGFSGTLRPHIAAVIQAINDAANLPDGPRVLAVDLPSGLDCETGFPSEPTIRADETVTFVASKLGFSSPVAQKLLGRLTVAGIGAPREILERVLREYPAS